MTGTRTGRLLDHNILANQPTGGILNKLNLYDQYTGKINDAVRTSDSWVCEIPSKFLEKTVDYVDYTQDPHKASIEFLHGLQEDGLL